MSSIASISTTTDPYQATNQSAFVQFVNDFNAIGNALRTGDTASAQNALAAFKDDLPGKSENSSDKPFGTNEQANSDYNSLASALQNGDLSGAQQAYSNLRTDLEGGGRTRRRQQRSSSATSSQTDQQTGATEPSEEEALLDVTA